MGNHKADLDRFIEMANIPVKLHDRIQGCAVLEGARPPSTQDGHESLQLLLRDLERAEPNPEKAKAEQADAAKRLRGTSVYVWGDPAMTIIGYGCALDFRQALIQIATTSAGGSDDRQVSIALPRYSSSNLAEIGLNGAIAVRSADTWESRLHNDFILALQGKNAARVRLCGCGCIYWAERTDKKTCSGDCRATAWRKHHPGRWKEIQYRSEEQRERRAANKVLKRPKS